MQTRKIIEYITDWLADYSDKSRTKGFVIGISGGIDSAVTSTLCALTDKPVLLVGMPIHQAPSQVNRAQEHIAWLRTGRRNVYETQVDLTSTFEEFRQSVPTDGDTDTVQLALANTRARLRMMTLYYHAGLHGYLVAGTGNKIEDFGVGFFTKYGDGGVDLSPIADLTKTEVYKIGAELGIAGSILAAAPTDGLFGDDRSDADQIGATYPELEWAMSFVGEWSAKQGSLHTVPDNAGLTDREREVLAIYLKRHYANRHKMDPIPVCLIPEMLKKS